MNETIKNFGYPATLLHEYDHWVVLLRPQQVTLGSLVVAAKGPATHYHDLGQAAFSEFKQVIADVEATLAGRFSYAKINYLMLMMVDPHVHYHVIPRYDAARTFNAVEFVDGSWPGPPALTPTPVEPATFAALLAHLKAHWPSA